MSTNDIPVVIVGAGPVGLALAIELGMSGVRCTVIEKREGTPRVPKMSGLSTRGMEFSRRWGIARKVEQAGWPATAPNDFVYCTSLVGYELARVKIPAYVDRKRVYSPERPCGCAQIYFDPLLLERARTFPSVTLRHLTRLDSFEQDANGVRARITDTKTGQSETLTARFLIACDGADSAVAKAAGIADEGSGIISNSVNIFFRSTELSTIHDKGWSRFFRFTDGGGSWGELIGIDGKELWRLSTFAADPAITPAEYIRRLAGRDVAHEILSVMEWQRREVVATRYRVGNVLLAGDSVHQHSPTGGLGLHTGLIDAVDLGWKLTAVLEGWGGDRLLDSYEAERKPIALKSVRVSTDEFNVLSGLPSGPEIADDTPRGAELRATFAEFFKSGAPKAHFNENLRLGYTYEGSPIVVPDGSPEPPPVLEFIPSARPGRRAPHAWIGEERSTLDLYGSGFVLLRLGANAPDADALVRAAAERRVPLRVVDLESEELVALHERRLVLVRPDGHVSWRADAVPADALSLIDRVRGA